MDRTRKLATCAILSALSVVFCIFAALIPSMSLSMLAICGVISMLALNLCGSKYAIMSYAVVSLLSILLAPDKVCSVYYIFLFGLYPLLKEMIEKIPSRVLSFVTKLLSANILCIVAVWLVSRFLGVSEIFSETSGFFFLIIYNAAFVLYDICLDRLALMLLSRRWFQRSKH